VEQIKNQPNINQKKRRRRKFQILRYDTIRNESKQSSDFVIHKRDAVYPFCCCDMNHKGCIDLCFDFKLKNDKYFL